jgi:outer membrane receptor protein involved in Fe transport
MASVGVSVLVLAAGAPALAQAQDAASGAVDQIVVTGSRIQTTGMKTVTPTTVLSQQVLADIAPGNVSQAVTQLPQFFNNTQPATSGPIGGALGATTVNLRGLGTNRTLTLMNGRRMVPFNQTGTVDISMFPQALTQRVDVVTGGASAAYGTDAVAGVVNFVLNDKFEGVDARLQGGMSSRGDDGNGAFSLALGHQFGSKLHVLGSVDWNHNDEISSYKDREWFQSWGTISDPADPTRKRLLVRPDVVATQYSCGGMINQPGSALNGLEFLEGGATAPFRYSTLGTTNGLGSGSAGCLRLT